MTALYYIYRGTSLISNIYRGTSLIRKKHLQGYLAHKKTTFPCIQARGHDGAALHLQGYLAYKKHLQGCLTYKKRPPVYRGTSLIRNFPLYSGTRA